MGFLENRRHPIETSTNKHHGHQLQGEIRAQWQEDLQNSTNYVFGSQKWFSKQHTDTCPEPSAPSLRFSVVISPILALILAMSPSSLQSGMKSGGVWSRYAKFPFSLCPRLPQGGIRNGTVSQNKDQNTDSTSPYNPAELVAVSKGVTPLRPRICSHSRSVYESWLFEKLD